MSTNEDADKPPPMLMTGHEFGQRYNSIQVHLDYSSSLRHQRPDGPSSPTHHHRRSFPLTTSPLNNHQQGRPELQRGVTPPPAVGSRHHGVASASPSEPAPSTVARRVSIPLKLGRSSSSGHRASMAMASAPNRTEARLRVMRVRMTIKNCVMKRYLIWLGLESTIPCGYTWGKKVLLMDSNQSKRLLIKSQFNGSEFANNTYQWRFIPIYSRIQFMIGLLNGIKVCGICQQIGILIGIKVCGSCQHIGLLTIMIRLLTSHVAPSHVAASGIGSQTLL